MPAYLLTSPARKEFKKHLGQANHQIITILVGLDAIERRIVCDVPERIRHYVGAQGCGELRPAEQTFGFWTWPLFAQ